MPCRRPGAGAVHRPRRARHGRDRSRGADARIGTYLALEGQIVERLREDYYTFTDGQETIRVEIAPERFAGRPVTPDTRIRIIGEVDIGLGGRYLWVTALDIL